jgi:beta-phosphoglucomutase-like phosphatase (HAD superfamily)
MIRAVVFDCDGVLVDSEPLADEIWNRALAGFGYETSIEDAEDIRGTSEATTYEYYAARVELPPFDDFMAEIDAIRIPVYEERLVAFDDAIATVQSLAAQGTTIAVASSSRRHALEGKLALTGLDRYFDVVVGGDEVEHGKPSPDVYLEAAKRLGVPPADCVAIEDADLGAESAAAAGMRAVMIRRDGSISPHYASVTELTADLINSWMWRF